MPISTWRPLVVLLALPLLAGCLRGDNLGADHGGATLFIYSEQRPEKFITLGPDDFEGAPMQGLQAALDAAVQEGNVTRQIPGDHVDVIIDRLDEKWRQTHGEPSAGRRHVEYLGKYFNVRLGG